MLQRCITCGVFSHRPILFLFPYLTLFLPILGGIQPLIVYYVTESRFLSGRIMFLMKPQHNSRVYHQLVKNIILSKLETPQLEKHYYIHGLTTGYKSLSYQLNQDFSLVEAWVLLKPKHNSRVCHHAYLSCISSFAIPTSLINFTWLSLKACSLGTIGSNQF